MKFPGKRKSNTIFPVNARDPLFATNSARTGNQRLTGRRYIDQTLVDIEGESG